MIGSDQSVIGIVADRIADRGGEMRFGRIDHAREIHDRRGVQIIDLVGAFNQVIDDFVERGKRVVKIGLGDDDRAREIGDRGID